MALHTWLQQFIQQHKITYTKLSEATGMNRGSLSKYVNGQHQPTVQTIGKIAEGLAKLTEGDKNSIMLQMVNLCLQ